MKSISRVPYLTAATVGACYAFYLSFFWAYYAFNNPVNNWLIETFAKQGHDTIYYLFTYSHDLVVNTVLAGPAALVLFYSHPPNRVVAVSLSVFSAIVFAYSGMEFSSLPLLVRIWGFWLGLGVLAAGLPLAFLAVAALTRSKRAV